MTQVVLRTPPGIALVPVRRPDGGWLYPIAGAQAGASTAGVAVDVLELQDEADGSGVVAEEGRLIDREVVLVAGRVAERTLVVSPLSPVVVVVEQWRLSVAGWRVVLTATADLAAWAALAPVLRAAVAGARLEFA